MTIDEKLDKILEILNGNGKMGLCAKVNTIWYAGSVFIFLATTAIVLLIRKAIL